MNRLNNVDLSSLNKTLKSAERDRSALRKTQVIEGEWCLDGPGNAQFSAEVAFEQGKAVLGADQPTMLGGSGGMPGPMHYCFYGIASCYAAVYASTAATMGIKLRKLAARVEVKQDFSRVFGLSDDPFIRDIAISLTVRGDAPAKMLQEIEDVARQRCPAVYTLTHPVELKSKLIVEEAVSVDEVMAVIRQVYDPDYFDRSIIDMGLVTAEDIEVGRDEVKVKYRLSAPICPFSAAIGLMIKHVVETKLGVKAEVRLMPGHYQYDVVNEVLSSEEKAEDLLRKMQEYGVMQRCVRG